MWRVGKRGLALGIQGKIMNEKEIFICILMIHSKMELNFCKISKQELV